MEQKDSCIFYRSWKKCLGAIPDKAMRCDLYDAIVDYALDGVEPELSPEYMTAWVLIKEVIDKDKEKYAKSVEQRRAAINSRWQKRQERKEEDDEKSANTYGRTSRNTENTSRIIRNTKNTVNDNVNVNDNVDDNVDYSSSSSILKNNLKKINTPQPPKGGVKEGAGKKGFRNYLSRVAAVEVPPILEKWHYENQYRWRMAEGMPAFSKAIDALLKKTNGDEAAFIDGFKPLENKYQPAVSFTAYKVAVGALLLGERAREAICDEVDRGIHNEESGIWDRMLGKIEYFKTHTVENPEAFVKARQDKTDGNDNMGPQKS